MTEKPKPREVVMPPGPVGLILPGKADVMPASPARLAWRRFVKNKSAMFGGLVLIALYSITLFGSFFQTKDPTERNYNATNHPPTLPRFIDEKGKLHLRPFVYGMKLVDPFTQRWEFDLDKKYSLYFFVRGSEYKLWWLFKSNVHLVGIEPPGVLAFFGTDAVGNDVYSRVIQGGKVSLSIGIMAIAISLTLGMFLGGVAGYYGGFLDGVIMRICEFLLSIPTLYLIISLRAYFQSETFLGIGGSTISSTEMYVIIIVILSFIGWAGQARVIRGMVLSIKEQDFVMAERAMGASTFRILALHILPNTLSYVIISASIAVPGYILGEVALSFLGVGITPPQVSWGNLLEAGQNLSAIKEFPWLLFAPSTAIFVTVMAFNFLGDGLRDALDPKHSK
jgi:peptide/nickel transport system permease protein